MTRSLSWIDSTTLQSALSRARATPGSAHPHRARFEAPVFDRPIAEAPSEPPQPTVLEPALPSIPHFHAQASLADRLRSLAVWVESELGPERWYIADQEGLALHVAGVSAVQVISAVTLARALRPLRGVLGPEPVQSVTMQLGDGRTLHILWCDTALGRVALGIENPRRASQEILRILVDALREALEP